LRNSKLVHSNANLLACFFLVVLSLGGCGKSPTPLAAPKPPPSISVVAAGDILLARAMGEQMASTGLFRNCDRAKISKQRLWQSGRAVV